ncbi:MAG: dihydrolipoamide acetyltransferase family protein [Candidatus Hydrogenedentales bacterium]|jgi:pyruvate dehydrogenase E2 component (dihydrolipoamide acetyltransferase)
MQEVKLPQMGQSVEEASIVRWIKAEGETIRQGDPLFAIQTDKAEIECEAPASGVLRKILLEPDISVPVLTVVALVGTADEPLPDLSKYGGAGAAPKAVPAATPEAAAAPVAEAKAVSSTTTQVNGGDIFVSPRARKRAADLHIDPTLAQGTGAGGRVTEADVEAYAASVDKLKVSPAARKLAESRGVDLTQLKGSGPQGRIVVDDVERAETISKQAPVKSLSTGEIKRTKLSPMRKIIAQRMADSFFSAPHYYVTTEIDMAAAVKLRNSTPEKPSFNDLIMFSTALALKEFPAVNSRWADDAIEEVGDINLGLAVALPTGLIVPVVRQVQNLTLPQLSAECKRLAERARTGKLTPDEYQGNTFTISNLGSFGVDHFTAIINQPDSAILAVGQIKDRPVVIDGGIQVRPLMKMTLSSDHRVIDGAVAAQFMGRLKAILEAAAF